MVAWNVCKVNFRQGGPKPLEPFTHQCDAGTIYWLFEDQV